MGRTMNERQNRIDAIPGRPVGKERRSHRSKLRGVDGSLQSTEEPAQSAGAEQAAERLECHPAPFPAIAYLRDRPSADKEIYKDGITPVIQIEQIGRTEVQTYFARAG